MNEDFKKDLAKESPRLAAAAVTLLAAVGCVWLMHEVTLSVSLEIPEWPPQRHSDVTVQVPEEQYFEVVPQRPVVRAPKQEPARVHNDVKANNKSTPAPESGMSARNSGPAGDAPTTVTTNRESAVKRQIKPATPVGPSQDEIEQQQRDEARRKANSAMSSAFQRSNGKNNTSASGREEGNSGSPDGTSQSVNGTGTGTVGGGWSMPSFAPVPSTVTGSVKVRAKIDRNGRVTSVSFIGGDAPAATNSRLRAAIEREIRSRRFSRPASAGPADDEATAFITYRFK